MEEEGGSGTLGEGLDRSSGGAALDEPGAAAGVEDGDPVGGGAGEALVGGRADEEDAASLGQGLKGAWIVGGESRGTEPDLGLLADREMSILAGDAASEAGCLSRQGGAKEAAKHAASPRARGRGSGGGACPPSVPRFGPYWRPCWRRISA